MLCFGGRSFRLKKGNDPKALPSQQGVTVLGLALPFTVRKETSVLTKTEETVLSEQEARQRCTQAVDALVYAELESVEILSREYKYEVLPQSVVCTAKLRLYADIAAERSEEP